MLAILWVVLMFAGCAKLNSKRDILSLAVGGPAGSAAYEHGLHAYYKGHLDKAAEKFELAIVQVPNHGEAYNNLGLVYFEQRKLALAAANFDIAIGLLPDNATPRNNLGMALEAGGRLVEAIGYYESAATLDPDNALYLGNLVRARMRLGETGDVLRSDLQRLAFIDTRADWLEWVDEQLALRENPALDRGPQSRNPLARESNSGPRQPDANAEEIELSPSFRMNDDSVELRDSGGTLPVPTPGNPRKD